MFVIVVAGGGYPTNSDWLRGSHPSVIDCSIELRPSFGRLLADAEHRLGRR
jgi:hypothetical protein